MHNRARLAFETYFDFEEYTNRDKRILGIIYILYNHNNLLKYVCVTSCKGIYMMACAFIFLKRRRGGGDFVLSDEYFHLYFLRRETF